MKNLLLLTLFALTAASWSTPGVAAVDATVLAADDDKKDGKDGKDDEEDEEDIAGPVML